MEEWKNVFLGKIRFPYQVSNLGRVRNEKGHILQPWKRGQRKGTYLCVRLCKKGMQRKIDIQRLVALHFIPNPEDKPEVNHINLNHFDNRAENLEWCTRRENVMHRYFMESHLFLEEKSA